MKEECEWSIGTVDDCLMADDDVCTTRISKVSVHQVDISSTVNSSRAHPQSRVIAAGELVLVLVLVVDPARRLVREKRADMSDPAVQ